ncbi:MAG: N-acetyltransferase [Coriobacteriia bacterium]|nr:N-acetyltransferase [Coriobacteriia bacterium]
MRIREATISDGDVIREIHLSAFGADEREIVAKLAVDLLSEDTSPPTIALVAEVDDDVIGHIGLSPVTTDAADGYGIYILAPLAVSPEHQRRGAGSRLVEDGKRRLAEMGVDLLLVYGDPAYYGRLGFSVGAAEGCIPPYDIEYSFGWQGVLLSERGIPESPLQLDCVASLRDPELW